MHEQHNVKLHTLYSTDLDQCFSVVLTSEQPLDAIDKPGYLYYLTLMDSCQKDLYVVLCTLEIDAIAHNSTTFVVVLTEAFLWQY